MERRVRLRHAERLEWRLISESNGKVVVSFGECGLKPGPALGDGKWVEFGIGTYDDEVRKAAERGYTVEIDERGEAKDEWARLQLELATRYDPRGRFEVLSKALPKVSAAFRLQVVERLQREVETIAEDMDEHDTPFARERPPDQGMVGAWRAFLSTLRARIERGEVATAADLRFKRPG